MNRYHLVLLLLFAIPITLWILPADYFDQGQSICLSVLLLGKTCPGCGMTRGVMHLMHFDIETAVYHNMFSLIALPVLFFIWLRWVRETWRNANAVETK
jgi:Protein of unknown function (DUF2752)